MENLEYIDNLFKAEREKLNKIAVEYCKSGRSLSEKEIVEQNKLVEDLYEKELALRDLQKVAL